MGRPVAQRDLARRRGRAGQHPAVGDHDGWEAGRRHARCRPPGRTPACAAGRGRAPASTSMSRSSPASSVTCTQMCGVLIGPSRQNSPLSIGRIDGDGPQRQLDVAREVAAIVDVAGAAMGAGRQPVERCPLVALAPRQRGQSRSQRSSSMPSRVASRQASITCRSGTPQRRASASGLIRSASTSSPSATNAARRSARPWP